MLSEENYKALLRFRDGLVKYDTKLTEREELLRKADFIRLVQRSETRQGTGYSMTYDQDYWKITALGKDALKEFEDAVQKMADDNAKHDEENRSEQLQALKDKKQSFRHDFVVAAFSALLTLSIDHHQEILNFVNEIFRFFFRHWPAIVSFLTKPFQT